MVAALLTNAGHQPSEATDVIEGTAYVRVNRLDLALTDVSVPTMDGYEFVPPLRVVPRIARNEVTCDALRRVELHVQDLALKKEVRRWTRRRSY